MSLNSTKYPNIIRTVKSGEYPVMPDDSVILVDTTFDTSSILHTTTLDLNTIPANYWDTQYKLYVSDIGNSAATYPITILAPTGFLINGAQTITINVNNGGVLIRILNNTNYIAEYSYGGGSDYLNSIPVANTVFIMKNGNDDTGLVERFDKPFLTFAGARAAIQSYLSPHDTNRIMVRVYSGDYNETIVLDPYVDFDLGDITLTQILDSSGDIAMITDYGNFADSIIQGEAEIVMNVTDTDSANNYFGVLIVGNSSKVILNCKSITCTETATIPAREQAPSISGVYLSSNATLSLNCENITCTNAHGVVYGIEADKAGIIYANVKQTLTTTGGLFAQYGIRSYDTTTIIYNGDTILTNNEDTTGLAGSIVSVFSQAGGTAIVRCNKITQTSPGGKSCAIFCGQATATIYCSYITSTATTIGRMSCIYYSGRSDSQPTNLYVECIQTTMNCLAENQSVIFASSGNNRDRAIFKGRYVCIDSGDSGLNLTSIVLQSDPTVATILDGVTLIGTNSGYSIYSSTGTGGEVWIYGSVQTNVNYDTSINLLVGTVFNGRFLVDGATI